MVPALSLLPTFVAGLLAGACLVAFALSRREASLTLWAAELQRKAADPAHGDRRDACRSPSQLSAVSPVETPVTVGPGQRYRWPVLSESVVIGDMQAFLRRTGQPWPVSDTWR